jgi:hypothetical protein
MPRNSTLKSFYASSAWQKLRLVLIAERGPICQRCGKLISNPLDLIGHHSPVELSVENVNNLNIALNPDNIKLICRDCHDRDHHRFGYQNEHGVYLVYGSPLSGKMSFVRQTMHRSDLVVNMDSIYTAISLLPEYDKPNNLLSNVIAVRNLLIDNVKTRYGKWNDAYVIGTYPDKYQREYIADELGAELVFCDASREECINRLNWDEARRLYKSEYTQYIDEWFERYTA